VESRTKLFDNSSGRSDGMIGRIREMEKRQMNQVKGRLLAMFARLEESGAKLKREEELLCGPVRFPRFTGPLSCNKILQEASCAAEDFAGARFWEERWPVLSQTLLRQVDRRIWKLWGMLESAKAFSQISQLQ
jgi:hypothetical protein